MKLFLVHVYFLFVVMVAIGTSSGAVTDSSFKTAQTRVCVDREGCTVGSCTCFPPLECLCNSEGEDCFCTKPCTGDTSVCEDNNPCTFDNCNVVDSRCENTRFVGEGFCTSDCPCEPSTCYEQLDPCPAGSSCLCAEDLLLDICVCACNSDEACDDGNACTVDKCNDGACSRTAQVCDDHDPCTIEVACDPKTGCVRKPAPCSVDCPCPADQECKCEGGPCTCVPKVVSPAVCPGCQTKINFDINTCSSTTSTCSGTP